MTHRHAIEPHQQFDITKGKNATDMKMTIDAMDLLFGGRVDGFGIMSSDSDFMPLAMRIRQDGVPVYGFGTSRAPVSFQQACSRFIDVAALVKAEEPDAAEDRPAAAKKGRRGADQAARRRLPRRQARRPRLCQPLRGRPARRQPLLIRRAQLRLCRPRRADRRGAELRHRAPRGRAGLREEGAIGTLSVCVVAGPRSLLRREFLLASAMA